MRIAVVVKQVPTFTEMALDDDGRLIRAGLPLELNPYCRRAVSQAVVLAGDGPAAVTVVTLGPPSAEDVLREAIAWGAGRGVEIDGLLITDPAFAGSDTLATARSLAAALRLTGPFDLILAGRNSVDADTGQVPPELAELLDLPFLTGVRTLQVNGLRLAARCEHDDGWVEAEVDLPAVLSCAERLIEPCKVDAAGRAAVPSGRIRRLTAADLGAGPWGQAGSPTRVGAVRVHEVTREGIVLDGALDDQVRRAVDVLVRRGALPASAEAVPGGGPSQPASADEAVPGGGPSAGATTAVPGGGLSASATAAVLGGGGLLAGGTGAGAAGDPGALPRPGNRAGPAVAVVLEADRPHVAQELLGAAAVLAEGIDGHVVAMAEAADADAGRLGAWGADEVVALVPSGRLRSTGSPDAPGSPGVPRSPGPPGPPGPPESELVHSGAVLMAEDVARVVAEWAERASPWAVLAPSTAWGREVASRAAARLGAGLTGDAVDLDLADGRLVAWKPAFGGQVVAAITASSTVQMATVRPGMLPRRVARPDRATITRLAVEPRGRVRISAAARDDDTSTLAEAAVVVGVGTGLTPDDYPGLQGLLEVLGAELGATRKVTDRGWQPHARQIGITGRSIAPNLYIAIGLSGKFNHMVGVRSAGTILAINAERDSPVFAAADVGITADWRTAVPALVAELRARL